MEWLNQLPLFSLVFIRITSFFLTAPIFMMRDVPGPFKIGLAFFLSVISLSFSGMPEAIPLDSQFWLLIVKEALVGICIGFAASMVLYAIQIAGIFIDMQSGFALASMFDPQTGVQTPLAGRLKYTLAILFLLSLNGHHLLIRGIFTSFEWIAVDQWIPAISDGRVSSFLTETFGRMFETAFLIAVPIAGALFLVDVALGIVAKTVPQMNVFVIGLPLKIMVNFMMMLIVLPGFFFVLKKLFADMIESLQAIIKIMGA